MKKLVSLLLCLIAITSCDKIKVPDQRPPQVYNCIDTTKNVVISSNSTYTPSINLNKRRVLLEDYTGHQCVNCPRAAEQAEALAAQYGDQLVVIANHVSDFAAPNRNPVDARYAENFKNDASTEWDKVFGMSNAGLPQGSINRTSGPNYPMLLTKWPSLMPDAINKPQVARIDIITYNDTLNHYLTAKVKTTFKTAYSNNVNLIVILTQDSITGEQKDGKPPASSQLDSIEPGFRINYRFDNIVIGSINGTWGQLVKAAPIAVNYDTTLVNSCYKIDKCFETSPNKVCLKYDYINIVAFIYDVTTYEVLQVEKMRIKPTKVKD